MFVNYFILLVNLVILIGGIPGLWHCSVRAVRIVNLHQSSFIELFADQFHDFWLPKSLRFHEIHDFGAFKCTRQNVTVDSLLEIRTFECSAGCSFREADIGLIIVHWVLDIETDFQKSLKFLENIRF